MKRLSQVVTVGFLEENQQGATLRLNLGSGHTACTPWSGGVQRSLGAACKQSSSRLQLRHRLSGAPGRAAGTGIAHGPSAAGSWCDCIGAANLLGMLQHGDGCARDVLGNAAPASIGFCDCLVH